MIVLCLILPDYKQNLPGIQGIALAVYAQQLNI